MKYYKIKLDANPKVTGKVSAQLKGILNPEGYNRAAKNSIYRVSYIKPFPKDLNVPTYVLNYHAKRTDYISLATNVYNLYSDKLINLLKSFKIPSYQTFPTQVIKRNETFPYSVFVISEFSPEFIDYKKSVFYKTHIKSPIEPIEVNTFEEYEKELGKLSTPFGIKAKKLVLNNEKIDVDIFRLRRATFGYFVSERFKNKIEKENITGLKFIPIEEIRTLSSVPYNPKIRKKFSEYTNPEVKTTITSRLCNECYKTRTAFILPDNEPKLLNAEELDIFDLEPSLLVAGHPADHVMIFNYSYVVWTNIDGSVKEVQLSTSSNGWIYDQVEESIRKARFEPTLKDGKPVEGIHAVKYDFTLTEKTL